jgi:myosin heavy subunit
MFKVEQQEYIKEKLDWSYINFNDNQECLDLIEQKPLGILSLLDEECRFPKSSPKSLALKLKQNHTKNQCVYLYLYYLHVFSKYFKKYQTDISSQIRDSQRTPS